MSDQFEQLQVQSSLDGQLEDQNQQAPRKLEEDNKNFQIEEDDQDQNKPIGVIKEVVANYEDKKQILEKILPLQPLTLNKSETKKIVNQAALERKTEAFEQTKNFEQIRNTQISQHRQLLESIWARLQKVVQQSDESMKFLVQFMKNKIEQEELQLKYFQQSQLGKIFKEFDGRIIQCSYPEFSKAVRNIDTANERQTDQIKIFITWMQNQIRERLEMEMNNFCNQNKELINTYSKFKKTLAELDKDITKYYTKYEKLYNSMTIKGKKPQKDFLRAELKFKFASQKLTLYQREFGVWLLNSWNQLKLLDTQRLDLVTHTLIELQCQIMNVYGKTSSFEIIINGLNGIKIQQEVSTLYSNDLILTKQELEFIQNEQQQELTQYFTNFQVIDKFADLSHPLILKLFIAQRDIGTIGKTWVESGIIITVDHYFLVFDGKPTRFSKPELRFPLDGMKMFPRNGFELEIQFVIPGLVMDSKKKLLVKFNKTDELEEIMYYLETVGQNKFSIS